MNEIKPIADIHADCRLLTERQLKQIKEVIDKNLEYSNPTANPTYWRQEVFESIKNIVEGV
jgi:hypothetical protein